MPNHDQLHRYLFKNHAVRGELVTLSDTFQHMLQYHHYPLPIQTLLGEMLVATTLLTATLKFDGDITVQLQGDGPLSLAVINGNNRQEMRGVARFNGDIKPDSSLKEMLGNGYLVITITPSEGERYQGVVALDGETFSEFIENYFRQSEQLPTRLFLRSGEYQGKPIVGGLLLQVLPAEQTSTENFHHLSQLTQTIKAEELFNLPANEVLYRLYHQESVTLLGEQEISFRCTCSKERCATALLSIPSEELKELLAAEKQIEIHCDYCGAGYLFDENDITELTNNSSIQ